MITHRYPIFFFIIFLLIGLLVSSSAFSIQNPDQTAIDLQKKGVHPLLITGLISLLPIFELRGAIPIGIALFKQNPFVVCIVAVVFNLLPILPILYLLLPVRRYLVKLGILKRFFDYLDNKAEKNSDIVEKYGEFGLALFVAIPLPVTGAWTGSLIAVFMGLPPLKSFIFISMGVFFAGIIVTLITIIGMRALILIVPIIVGLVLLLMFKYLQISTKKRRIKNGKRGGST